jgi:protocatechuate 3,4-dioxygenase beta subunit
VLVEEFGRLRDRTRVSLLFLFLALSFLTILAQTRLAHAQDTVQAGQPLTTTFVVGPVNCPADTPPGTMTDVSVTETGSAAAYASPTDWSRSGLACGDQASQAITLTFPCGTPDGQYELITTLTNSNPTFDQTAPVSSTYDVFTPTLSVSVQMGNGQYNAGDTATFTGNIALSTGVYGSQFSAVIDVSVDGSVVGQVPVGSDLTFSGSFPISSNMPSGTHVLHAVVSAGACFNGSSANTSFTVSESPPTLQPTLQVTVGASGNAGYPGDAGTISGSGWAPNQPVTLNFGGVTVTADNAGSFTSSFTISPDAQEGSYTVTATQGSLTQSAVEVVKWHQLSTTLAAAPAQINPGGTVTFSGTVTREDGQPVDGAVVSITAPDLGISISATTDASGAFTTQADIPKDAAAKIYTVSAIASKTGGYKDSGAATAAITVSVGYSPTLVVAFGTGGNAGYPGDQGTITGSGWTPNQPVTLNIAGGVTVTADNAGGFTESLAITSDAQEGTYTVVATQGQLTQSAIEIVMWHQLSTTLAVSPTQINPGGTVTLSGYVTREDGQPVDGAIVTITSLDLGISASPTTDASGAFSTQAPILNGTKIQTYTISATASKTGGYKASSAATQSISVVTCTSSGGAPPGPTLSYNPQTCPSQYNPQLKVDMGAHMAEKGDSGYPGDSMLVTGKGWVPNSQVTINFGGLFKSESVTTDSSGEFIAEPKDPKDPSSFATIAMDTPEGAYTITATQPPSCGQGSCSLALTATATATVKWHQLTLVITAKPTTVAQGDNLLLEGTVTREDGQSVEFAAVVVTKEFGPPSITFTTNSHGQFSELVPMPSDAATRTYTITATAILKGEPYKNSAPATTSITVKLNTPSSSGTGAVVGAAAAVAGAAAGATEAGVVTSIEDASREKGTSKKDQEKTEEDTPNLLNRTKRFRIRFCGLSVAATLLPVQIFGLPVGYSVGATQVELQERNEDYDRGKGSKWGTRRILTLVAHGPFPGWEYGISVGASGWQDFTTTTWCNVDDFAGFGAVGSAGAMVGPIGGGTPTVFQFGNGEKVVYGGGLSFSHKYWGIGIGGLWQAGWWF